MVLHLLLTVFDQVCSVKDTLMYPVPLLTKVKRLFPVSRSYEMTEVLHINFLNGDHGDKEWRPHKGKYYTIHS